MKSFNVIWWDFNNPEPEPYDVIPYLVKCYKKIKDKPVTHDEFKEFIINESRYMWWSRCQYEIIIEEWPPREPSRGKKWDIHRQVMMNIDIITDILMEEVSKIKSKRK